MHIYDESTSRRTVWRVKINWSRELTFSTRQTNFIRGTVPHDRGVYCIYSKNHTFSYTSPEWSKLRWNSVIYVGSGWLDDRLCAHLTYQKNNLLAQHLGTTQLGYRYSKIVDSDVVDWSKTVEAGLLGLFQEKFGRLPQANRRQETFPDVAVHRFILQQSGNFNYLARG
jgi:hypothetical protein